MGNEIAAARSTELFSFNGHYSVPGDNTLDHLLTDARCIMASALALFRTELEAADGPEVQEVAPELPQRLYGIYHLLQVVEGIIQATGVTPQKSTLEHVA